MSASDHLSPIQFSFNDYTSAANRYHTVRAKTPEGEHVGALSWHADRGDVEYVRVEDGHRRQGVATGMWNYAQGLKDVQTPRHAPADDRSADGKAWAKSVKGPGYYPASIRPVARLLKVRN